MNSLDDLGKKIKMLRQQLGLSQAALGERVNISQKEISHYETNYRRPPVEILPSLAETLGTTIEDLYGEIPKRDGETALMKRSIWLVAEKMEQLTESERRLVLSYIESLLEARNRNSMTP